MKDNKPRELQEYLTVKEAAQYLSNALGIKINRARLDTWRAREQGPKWVPIGSKGILYHKDALDEFCRQRGPALLAYERRKAPRMLEAEPPADSYIRADRLLATLSIHHEGIAAWDEEKLIKYLDSYEEPLPQSTLWQGHYYVPKDAAKHFICELIEEPSLKERILAQLGIAISESHQQQPGDLPLPWP